MIIKCYEVIFSVTETQQNGKEWTHRKSVLTPITKNGRHVIELTRVDKAIKELESLKRYYNIQYVETKPKTLIVTDTLEAEGV